MKKNIFIVCFGTANLDAFKLIERFVENVKESLEEEVTIKVAFTSKMLIRAMKEKNNIIVPNIEESLKKSLSEGYKEIIIQPLHMMEGKEFYNLIDFIDEYRELFDNIKVNSPLFKNIANCTEQSTLNIVNAIKDSIDKERDIVIIGHGSNMCSNECYNNIEKAFYSIGYKKVIVGTLEGEKTKEVILNKLIEKDIRNVQIMTLLILPGNHILRDITGDNSWQKLFEDNNIDVEVKLKSLLEYETIQKLYIEIIKDSIKNSHC